MMDQQTVQLPQPMNLNTFSDTLNKLSAMPRKLVNYKQLVDIECGKCRSLIAEHQALGNKQAAAIIDGRLQGLLLALRILKMEEL